MQIKSSISQKPTVAIGSLFRLCLLATLGSFASSCITTLDEQVEIHAESLEDSEYATTYMAVTNQYEVIENFETKYVISASYLTHEFRNAIATRHQKIFSDPAPILSEASSKTGFFITLYVANDEAADLRDQNLWSLTLKQGSQKIPPVLVKKLSRKERWRTFFPSINLWTQEYLVLFDSPATGSGEQKLLEESQQTLMISNADAQVKMTW